MNQLNQSSDKCQQAQVICDIVYAELVPAFPDRATLDAAPPTSTPASAAANRAIASNWAKTPPHNLVRAHLRKNAENKRQSVGAPLVGALRGLFWRPDSDAIALHRAQDDCIQLGQDPRPYLIRAQLRKNRRKRLTHGRGAPCGRPSWVILASGFRCDCPASRPGRLHPIGPRPATLPGSRPTPKKQPKTIDTW